MACCALRVGALSRQLDRPAAHAHAPPTRPAHGAGAHYSLARAQRHVFLSEDANYVKWLPSRKKLDEDFGACSEARYAVGAP